MQDYFSVRWVDGVVKMLDQRLLPGKIEYVDLTSCWEVAEAIREMLIRGAPAIGIAAGFGLALTASHSDTKDHAELIQNLRCDADELRKSRPTAINLFVAIDRILNLAENDTEEDLEILKSKILIEAQRIADEDLEMNQKIGQYGQQFIPTVATLIHHCNTGALATGGYGTALGVIRTAHEMGKKIHVYVDETRPRLQGARLTSWELQQLDVPHTVIVDGASGYIMRRTRIDACLVGCDRIAANGDVANKIGTYNLSLAAHAHGVPFYSIGPRTSIDLSIATGDGITIEERPGEEITHVGNLQVAPDGVAVSNPAFDITPAKYITAIITDAGVAFPPYETSLQELLKK